MKSSQQIQIDSSLGQPYIDSVPSFKIYTAPTHNIWPCYSIGQLNTANPYSETEIIAALMETGLLKHEHHYQAVKTSYPYRWVIEKVVKVSKIEPVFVLWAGPDISCHDDRDNKAKYSVVLDLKNNSHWKISVMGCMTNSTQKQPVWQGVWLREGEERRFKDFTKAYSTSRDIMKRLALFGCQASLTINPVV